MSFPYPYHFADRHVLSVGGPSVVRSRRGVEPVPTWLVGVSATWNGERILRLRICRAGRSGS